LSIVLGKPKFEFGEAGMNKHVDETFASGFGFAPTPEHAVGPPPASVSKVIGVDAKLPTPEIAKPSPTGQACEADWD